MVLGISELKSLHSDLSGHLSPHKYEKYLLYVVMLILLSRIQYGVDLENTNCEEIKKEMLTKENCTDLCLYGNRNECDTLYVSLAPVKSIDKKILKECLGKRLSDVILYFTCTVIIIVALLVTQDVWIDWSESEIRVLLRFVDEKNEAEMCDNCAEKLLVKDDPPFRDKDCHYSRIMYQPVPSYSRIMYPQIPPPPMEDLAYRHKLQIWISIILLSLACYIFNKVASKITDEIECKELSTHKCMETNNRYVMCAIKNIVICIHVFIIFLYLNRYLMGIPYQQLLKLLQKSSIRKALID